MTDFKFDIQNYSETLPWIFSGGAGMLGRLMYHAKQVEAGKRKPLGWVLLWDIPIAIGMGWLGLGIAAMLRIPAQQVVVSIAMVSAYLGPYTIDTIFAKWSDIKFGKEPKI